VYSSQLPADLVTYKIPAKFPSDQVCTASCSSPSSRYTCRGQIAPRQLLHFFPPWSALWQSKGSQGL
jgi:hypothetical protein